MTAWTPLRHSSSFLRSCFALVEQHGLGSIALPSISTGAYAFPIERASRIAVREIRSFLARKPDAEKVVVVCFGRQAYDCYQVALQEENEDES